MRGVVRVVALLLWTFGSAAADNLTIGSLNLEWWGHGFKDPTAAQVQTTAQCIEVAQEWGE